MVKEQFKQIRKFVGTGFGLVFVASVTLAASSLIQYMYSARGLREEATKIAEGELKSNRLEIMNIIDLAQSAVKNNVSVAASLLDYPEYVLKIPSLLLAKNPDVAGSTLAFVPDCGIKVYDKAPYAFRDGEGNIKTISLDTESYDYTSKDWFIEGTKRSSGYWTEPYVDEGGGEFAMLTFSMPVKDKDGKTVAVLTADISLEWLTGIIGQVDGYPNAYSTLTSGAGIVMVSPIKSMEMRTHLSEVSKYVEDPENFSAMAEKMLAGESGSATLKQKNGNIIVYYAPVERTGWIMGIVVPEKDIFKGLDKLKAIVATLQILGMLMILLILAYVAREQIRFKEVNDNKLKMEQDLHIASTIQMSMLPKTFPPFPDRHDIDMSASIVPAKEVGGDLYDFFIRDEKLYFCIGDVSGKGVPAALVMAMTRSMFRTVAAQHIPLEKIVETINDAMAQGNDVNMFVTFFCGILDMQTGELQFCNAGHNAPLLLSDKIRVLPVESNIALGLFEGFEFKTQSIRLHYDDALFLYTDGVTEAENEQKELFGEKRMEAVLHSRRTAEEHLATMQKAVEDFVGDAPQSDDITMLFIHYLGCREVSITFDNKIDQLEALPGFVEDACSKFGIEDQAAGINLALEEALANVMLYAYPEGTTGTVTLKARGLEGGMEFILSDEGKPFDPTAAPEADISMDVDERPIGGLGIFLVKQIMDSVSYEYRDGHNVLTMIKNK